MKVGTDGVLLGAWANLNSNLDSSIGTTPNTNNIQTQKPTLSPRLLDIGTGTGLIALMLAQRFPTATIDAIDINANACLQAQKNVAISPWPQQISIYHTDLKNFPPPPSSKFSNTQPYQLIVSNPPFFINSKKSNNKARNQARHTDSLPFELLQNKVIQLLATNSSFCIILPYIEGHIFQKSAEAKGLFLQRKTTIFPKKSKTPNRLLMQFGLQKNKQIIDDILTIRQENNNYTTAYKTLTKDFYLHF